MIRLRSRGDTIVEVLLAIAVISGVMAVAFATVSRASNNARQSQERGEATKLIESQIERLKASASGSSSDIFSGVATFCLDVNSDKNDSGALPPLNSDTFSVPPYNANCKVDQAGNTYAGVGVEYNLTVVRDAVTPNNFTVTCRWLRAGGSGKEQASISYRIYQ